MSDHETIRVQGRRWEDEMTDRQRPERQKRSRPDKSCAFFFHLLNFILQPLAKLIAHVPIHVNLTARIQIVLSRQHEAVSAGWVSKAQSATVPVANGLARWHSYQRDVRE